MNKYAITASARDNPVQLPLWKKLQRQLSRYKWPLIGIMWATAFVLGYLGFSSYFSESGESKSFWDKFYLCLQLFTMESGSVSGAVNWELQVARYLAPSAAIFTVLQALAIILHEQLQLFRLKFMSNHVVICGLGRKGELLTLRFRDRGDNVVAIELDEDNSEIGKYKDHGATVLIGSATDPVLLRRAQVHRAKYLISVCGDDGANAEVAVYAREIVKDRKGTSLTCLVHIVDLELCNLLRERQIRMARPDAFRLEFFNIYESGARVILNEYPPFGNTSNNDSVRSHIVIVGIGRMGESLVINAARNWLNRECKDGDHLRITMVDREVDAKKKSLALRYPHLEAVCELVSTGIEVLAPEFEKADFVVDPHNNFDVTTIYVCVDDDERAMEAALKLHRRTRSLDIPIIVRMSHDAGLATLMHGEADEQATFANIHAYGLLDRTCTPDLMFGCAFEIMARATHEDYIRQQTKLGFTPDVNPSMIPWEGLPESLKESNRNQAEYIGTKLAAIGCDIAMTTEWEVEPFEFSQDEIELMARMEHERFMQERLSQGWTFSTEKNIEKKMTPTLILWNELSEEEKEKDRDTVRAMAETLARARFHIYRAK